MMLIVFFFIFFPIFSCDWFDKNYYLVWKSLSFILFFAFVLIRISNSIRRLNVIIIELDQITIPSRTNWGAHVGKLIDIIFPPILPGELIGGLIDKRIHDQKLKYHFTGILNKASVYITSLIIEHSLILSAYFLLLFWLFYLDDKGQDYFFLIVTKTVWMAIFLCISSILTIVLVTIDIFLFAFSLLAWAFPFLFFSLLNQKFPLTKLYWEFAWDNVTISWYYQNASFSSMLVGFLFLIGLIMLGLISKR